MVRMAIFVFPAPLWAALMAMEIMLNIIPPMMIWKYRTAPAWVSSLAPQSRIMGSAKKTQAMLINVPTARVKAAAIKSTWLAPYWSFSPRRLATRADTETLVAMKMHSPMNLGWVVSPTAATASVPSRFTRWTVSPVCSDRRFNDGWIKAAILVCSRIRLPISKNFRDK